MSLSFVFSENRWSPSTGTWTNYDFATNTFLNRTQETEYLIDPAGLRHALGAVIGYLAVMAPIEDQARWMVNTARVLAELGRRVYLVTDDEQQSYANWKCPGVSVEHPKDLENLDPLSLSLRNANLNVQLLADPAMIQRTCAGALNEMTRWDK